MQRAGALLCIVILNTMAAAIADDGVTPTEPSLEKGRASTVDMQALGRRVAALETALEYTRDRQEIHDLYLRYVWGFDRRDTDLVNSTFWPDAQINYGQVSYSRSADFVAESFNAHNRITSNSRHLINEHSVDLDGDVAHVEAYVTEFSTLRNGRSRIVGVRYIDRLDRRNEEWRVSVREVIFQFFTETDNNTDANMKEWLGGKPYSLSPCGMGTLDKRDPTYIRPLKPRPKNELGAACAE